MKWLSSTLFALDIGTRSVVGIILEEQEEGFHVKDILVEEHKERAMLDGQIHNVLKVAEVIQSIKEKLEEKYGKLEKVSVAAAGRALKTEQASATINIKNRPIFSEEDVSRLELSAVQKAQSLLVQAGEGPLTSHYYCVGYSVLYYKLDGEEIGSLVDQQGNEATIEVIATFLPRVVVESLLSALKRANLEMEALTLEPIAAINVLIPPSMRRLNVALVDIGAGTSDIAITDLGTVVAYGMVPYAGDEITEALSDHYLLDFPLSEKAKRQINDKELIEFEDILGFKQQIPKDEVIDSILPSIHELATYISLEILRLNNKKSPKAVMLVGGGSLTPRITSILAEKLQLPANRVAVRGIDAIPLLTKESHIPTSPELVTPIGIAIAAKKAPIQYMTVEVNNQLVRLFELKEMTVGDALLAANIPSRKLYGKPGPALSVTINGQTIHVPGEHGHPAILKVNGASATTKTQINHHDQIEVIEGEDGKPATATIQDLLDVASVMTVIFQGVLYTLEPVITINGNPAGLSSVLHERDKVQVEPIQTIEQFLKTRHPKYLEKLTPYSIKINNQNYVVPRLSSTLSINNSPARLSSPIQQDDVIHIEGNRSPSLHEVAECLDKKLTDKITVFFQGDLVELTRECATVSLQNKKLSSADLVPNGSSIIWEEKENTPWIFQDVFRYMEWTLPKNVGSFEILRNGNPSGFNEEIVDGDKLDIIFR